MLAVAEDATAAQLMGIRSDTMQAIAWAIAAGATGLAGAMIATFFYIVPTVGETLGIVAFVTMALGGFGSVPGALVAGLLIGVIESLSGYLIGAVYKDIVVYALFYGFLDAETDQYAPELVLDNTHIDPPGSYASGYHLTADLVDQAIRFIADHIADRPDLPWLTWLAFGACHAPHQAPADIIGGYDALFAHGWDVEREERLSRQKAMASCRRRLNFPRAMTESRRGSSIAPTRDACSRACSQRLPACSTMPIGIWRG